MFEDARDLGDGAILQADVCVAGAGAAGITLARGLRDQGLRVILLESGGLDLDAATQDLYSGSAVGTAPIDLTGCRARFFGGSTHWWAGWCRALDEDIFEARDWVPRSGWPITRQDLLPHYRQAHESCQIGAFEYDPDAVSERLGRPVLPFEPELAANVIYQYSPPSNFGAIYRTELNNADDINVILNANLVNIALSEDGASVARFECATLDGTRFSVQADRYVMALGGIETPRMLLASNTQESAGVGNSSDMVGRCFMEHPHFYRGGFLLLPETVDMSLYTSRHDVMTRDGDVERQARVVAALGLSPALRRQHGLMALAATVSRGDFNASADVIGPLARQVGELVKPGGGFALYSLDLRVEQAPNPDSRITLTEARDALGIPRIELNWLIQDEDKESVRRTLELIGAGLGKTGQGRLWMPLDNEGRYDPPFTNEGCHHMGTTRMSADPSEGVVDANLKVHDTDNLYIASCSVFPCGGFANPTLTIVALAHRLAQHLAQEMS